MFEFLESLAGRFPVDTAPTSDEGTEPTAFDVEVQLVDEIVELERAKAMIEARVMVLTADLADRSSGWVDPLEPRLDDLRSDGSFAAGELAPALHLAPVTAGMRVQRAVRLRDYLPATLGALGDGNLDIGRVLAIDDATRFLTAENCGRVERLVLSKAVDQTAGELRAALRKAVIAVDPDGAEQRRKAAVRERGVTRYQREDGMSALEAVLSAIDTGEIYDLIDEVAKRTKTTDDTRSVDARRADAFVWLMLGRDPQLGPEDPDDPDDPASPDFAGPTDAAGPCPPPVDPDEPGVHPGDPRDEEPDQPTSNENGLGSDQPQDGAPCDDQPYETESFGDEHFEDEHYEDEDRYARDQAAESRLDEDRAADSEYGPESEHAGWSQWPDARESAERDAALNRFDRARDARTAKISELASLALSAMTSRRPQRPRCLVIHQVRLNGKTVLVGELEGYGPITGESAQALLDSGVAQVPDPPSGREPTAEQADRHDPPDWLDTDIRARDGTCRSPGCRRPSRRGDLDHTIRFPDGKTVPSNLGALCRRHHRMKHSGAWHASQDDAGLFTWTSMITGRTYVTYPRGMTGEYRGATTVWERAF